jgi:hypothetical protein
MPDNKSDEKSMSDVKIEYSVDVESLKKPAVPFVYSPEEKNVKRKIDRAFLPLVILILFTQVTFLKLLFCFFTHSSVVYRQDIHQHGGGHGAAGRHAYHKGPVWTCWVNSP